MKIRYFQIATIFAVLSVSLIWEHPVSKALILPVGIILLIERNAESLLAIIFSTAIVGVYFFTHGISGTHDLKVLFVILQFLFLAKIFSISNTLPIVGIKNLYVTITIIVAMNIILINNSFTINFLATETERFRGIFPYPLITFMVLYLPFGGRKKIKIAIILFALGFMISGTRSHSAIFLLLTLCMVLPIRRKYYFMPLAFLAPQIFAYIYYIYNINTGTIDNITIRALTQLKTLENLTFLGNGITPPLDDFFAYNTFKHYFVPADGGALGAIYEIGLLAFILKILFVTILFNRKKTLIDMNVVAIGASYFLFSYGLTYDIADLVFSLVVISVLPKTSDQKPEALRF